MPHPNLLSASNMILVVVDIQERLLPAMYQPEMLLNNTRRLILGCAELGVPIILTEQYPKGLGTTVSSVQEALDTAKEKTTIHRVEKTTFACDGTEAYLDILDTMDRDQVVLCGIESHVCVLQTAFGMQEQGAMTFVAADAVTSRNAAHVPLALERMRQVGVNLPVTESILFEMLADAKHPAFKTIAALVK